MNCGMFLVKPTAKPGDEFCRLRSWFVVSQDGDPLTPTRPTDVSNTLIFCPLQLRDTDASILKSNREGESLIVLSRAAEVVEMSH